MQLLHFYVQMLDDYRGDMGFITHFGTTRPPTGTGFSARDMTPEATLRVVTKQLPSLPLAIVSATSSAEPLSFLSRGVAGLAGTTVILNVPGAPRAVAQHLAVGLPLVAHAVAAARDVG